MLLKDDLKRQFGSIDIYLFDQLLKGRFDDCENLLDVGCGNGRNLTYFLRCGLDVYGVDQEPAAIEDVRKTATELAPKLPPENFQAANVDALPFGNRRFDAVIANAVLHFATNEFHFNGMLNEIWRVMKPGGFLFARLASSIGLENRIKQIEGRRFLLPDGTRRFLVDENMLLETTERLNAVLLDPIKTTNVQNQRCMTTWCIQKNGTLISCLRFTDCINKDLPNSKIKC